MSRARLEGLLKKILWAWIYPRPFLRTFMRTFNNILWVGIYPGPFLRTFNKILLGGIYPGLFLRTLIFIMVKMIHQKLQHVIFGGV
jgi:hypothetical protein